MKMGQRINYRAWRNFLFLRFCGSGFWKYRGSRFVYLTVVEVGEQETLAIRTPESWVFNIFPTSMSYFNKIMMPLEKSLCLIWLSVVKLTNALSRDTMYQRTVKAVSEVRDS